MSEDQLNASGGVGFCGLLAILFIGLKLTDHIDWSWVWVLSPLWIPPVLVLTLLGIIAAVVAVGMVISAVTGKP